MSRLFALAGRYQLDLIEGLAAMGRSYATRLPSPETQKAGDLPAFP
ncbi:MAG: hypothetical protein ACYC42_03290 [Lysobacter sp.]